MNSPQNKRRAAASVFQEQNLDNLAVREESVDAAPLPSPAPMPQPSTPAPRPAQAFGGMPHIPPTPQRSQPAKAPVPLSSLKTSEELQLEKEPLRVRETGVWLWRRVVIPPNAYVIHTRIGKKDPVTLGLGLSFRYNPNTDAYLVVPAAMQTIGVVANCISQEKQGINILAYVQWQINDFSVAYRKLDFSDTRDPLGIVNAQLREQAEAAIKDKIATMSVEEVLTDKAPIIEELTSRLKAVAEGRTQDNRTVGEGLGIVIVTVQIKEAIVSSQRLWEHLQAPFRYEKEQADRISYLLMQDEIHKKELETRSLAETRAAETQAITERITQSKQTEAFEIRVAEETARYVREQELARSKIQLGEQTTLAQRESVQKLQAQALRAEQEIKLDELRLEQTSALEQARLDAEASARKKKLDVERAIQELGEEARLAQIRLQAEQERLAQQTELRKLDFDFQVLIQERELALRASALEADLMRKQQEAVVKLRLEEEINRVKLALTEREVEITHRQQEIRNLMNEHDLLGRLVEQLPALASAMPEIERLTVLQSGDGAGPFDSMPIFLAKMLSLAQMLGLKLPVDHQETSPGVQTD